MLICEKINFTIINTIILTVIIVLVYNINNSNHITGINNKSASYFLQLLHNQKGKYKGSKFS